jgi:hypothetical protein
MIPQLFLSCYILAITYLAICLLTLMSVYNLSAVCCIKLLRIWYAVCHKCYFMFFGGCENLPFSALRDPEDCFQFCEQVPVASI